MTDVQYIVDGPEPGPAVLTAIDRLAATLDAEDGWRITVDIDPGTRVVASPAPERPSEAPLSPQDRFSARGSAPIAADGSDGRTA
jgi:carbamate kinase